MSQRHLVASALLTALAGPAALRAQGGASPGARAAADTVGPSTIQYKGVRLTPIGFFAAEAWFRQRNLSADVGSSFNAIPFPHTANGQLTEFRASARQSRLGLLGEGRAGRVGVTGYFEGDFLTVGVTSNSNESNSYAFRVRQFFGQAAFDNGWTLTAGQTWSLLTPGRKGIAARGEYVPSTVDAQYVVGFNWARQFGVRATYAASRHASFAVALEEPQTTFSVRGALDPSVAVFVQQPGGSLLNSGANYSLDVAPDAHAKLAFDEGIAHVELKAVGRLMRDRIYTVVPASGGGGPTYGGARNHTTGAGGVGASAFVSRPGAFDLGLDALYGRGIGRYGSGQLPDATVNARGEVVPIRAAHVMATLDLHPTPRLDVYGYGGAEYAYRTADVSSAGRGVGYGSALLDDAGCDVEALPTTAAAPATGACNADTRALYQGTAGFWYRFYRGTHGTVQWGAQYSYTSRNAWSASGATPGAGPVQPTTSDNMLFTSFRYYLP